MATDYDHKALPEKIEALEKEAAARKNAELQLKQQSEFLLSILESLAQVRQLSGMLPICASCKKIRDDKGYWNQIEEYIRHHSEAEFSHGICPDCSQKLYPVYHRQKQLNKDK